MSVLQGLPALGALLTSTLRSDLRKARSCRTGSDATTELARDGIVIVPDFYPSDACEELSRRIRDFVCDFEQTTTLDNGVKVNFRGSERGQHTYHDREVADTGMVDIFDIDRQLPALDVIKNHPRLTQTIRQSCGTPVAATSMHAYLNRSVSGTRGYHIDSGGLQYKAFVYLTDVREKADGPYSYVRGSHLFSLRKYRNIARNLVHGMYLTEMGLPDSPSVVHALAPRGTLIISDQNGWHRGLPQEPGHERILLSINFAPAS